jgi:hypothetical protein
MTNPAEDQQRGNNQADPRFDHFVVDLLARNDGVFFGELHDHPELRQSIAKLLPYFKAHGVETISIELPQNMVDQMKGFANKDEMKKRWPRAGEATLDFLEVVKTAQRLEIRVLGHEKPLPDTLYKALHSPQEHEGDVSTAYDFWSGSEKGRGKRDEFAASHIRANRKGKFLAIGGWTHSGNFTKADMDDPQRETDYGYSKSQDTHNPYQGLDVKLGIPSIDYRKAYPTDALGAVNTTNGKFSTYEVALPESGLGQLYPSGGPAKHLAMPNKHR